MFDRSRRPNRVIPGALAVGAALAVSCFGIVRAQQTVSQVLKVFNCDGGVACVEGRSTGGSTFGVYGLSPSDGVQGETRSTAGKAGVRGISRGTAGIAIGVFGSSSNGDGVDGVSRSTGTGIAGLSEKGDGVRAESQGHGAFAVHAQADRRDANIFGGFNLPNHASCVIDPQANLSCTGSVTGGSELQSEHRNARGQNVIAYAAQAATATIEDVGTGRMADGVANVRIDSAFAAMTDRRWYYVFITPMGDTRGLYVSLKTPSAFQVRENERGRSNVTFDYRIVAHPLDAANDRLPAVRPAP